MNYHGRAASPPMPHAMRPVMAELGKRGLIYLDDGSSARSMAPRAGAEDRRAVRGRRSRDRRGARPRRDRPKKLDELERIAREPRASPLGTGSAFDVTVERVASWINDARKQGIEIVPVSAVAIAAGPRADGHVDDRAARSRNAALPALRRHHGARTAQGRVWVGRRSRRWRDGRIAALADAAGRHRQGRGPARGGAARARRGDRHRKRRAPRRERRTGSPTTCRRIWSAASGGAAFAARRRNGSPARSSATNARSTSPPQHPEFDAWRWVEMAELPALIVPFKRKVYRPRRVRAVARASAD